MSPDLGDLPPVLAELAWLGFYVFLRVGAVVALMPAFGERSVPVRIKLALALAFTAIAAPAAPTLDMPGTAPDLARVVAAETLAGTVVGMMLRLFVLALQTAGSIAAQSTSLAQLLGAAATEPIPAMGFVLVLSGLALAVSFGLHADAARLMINSYDLLPAGRFPDASVVSEWGVQRVAQTFRLAFALAAPFAIASLIYNLTLGAINRAMPQLMVAFVGAPFTTFGGLFLLFLAAPAILTAWQAALSAFLAAPGGIAP